MKQHKNQFLFRRANLWEVPDALQGFHYDSDRNEATKAVAIAAKRYSSSRCSHWASRLSYKLF